jgi:hypothetical protein
MERDTKTHESYGVISISRFTSNKGQFFNSDIIHNGGITITISNAETTRKYGSNTVFATNDLIEVTMSNNQFIDAITSGMNTSGVPCTISRVGNKRIPQINHVEDQKLLFQQDMSDTHKKYHDRIEEILLMLDGNIGKRKAAEIKSELEILKSHISSNTNFVMKTFTEAMENTVTEAKASINGYIDQKVHSLGIEAFKNQLAIDIE